MRLKELEIQGFKSFPDRTRVTIEPGITAVVGPNGSGKSNISDAIRWVLGETSARQLRGAGKMENVIFGGTQLRGAMGYAAVTLRVDNRDRRLEIDEDEVAIGRRYYRSGESEYTINGQNVRLKDVYELLLDTGMGRDGYSIIGQGRIAEIVGAKSAERREIFEEASGIARYRYRKTEAERRLASAESNLERLRDIVGELESRVGPLKKESEKAEKFLELSARRKEREVTLWVDSIHRTREQVREQQRRFETAQADYDRMTREIEEMDAETDDIRMEIQQISVELDRYHQDIRTITEEMAGSESRIAVLNNDIAHNDASIAASEEELRRGDAGDEAIQKEIEQHQQEIEALHEKMKQLDERIAAAAEQLEAIQADSQKAGERRGAVAAQLTRMTERQTAARVQAAASHAEAQAAADRMEAARRELEKDRQLTAQLEGEQQENRQYLKKIGDDLSRLANIEKGLQLKLQSRQKQLQQSDEAEQQITREMEAATQKVAMLREMEKNMDGYQSSVKAVMRAAQNRRLRGIIGPVSSILTVKPGYEMAVETALGFALQNIVVDGENAAKAAIGFLKEERAGRATFLPLDTVRGQQFTGALSGSAVVASSLVSYDRKYEGIVASLLGRIIVVDDLNEAGRVAKSLNYRNRIVTVDGQVVNAGGSFTGGSTSRSAGLFSRKQEIDDLRKKLDRLAGEQEKAQEASDKWKAEVDALKAELTATSSESITANGDKIRAEMEESRIESALSQSRGAAELLEAELEQLQQQKERSAGTEQENIRMDAQLTEDLAKLEVEMSELAGNDDSFLATHNRLSEELSSRKMERLNAEKDESLHLAAIQSLQSRTGENQQHFEEVRKNIASLQQLNRENRSSIEAIQKAAEDCRSRIAGREQDIREATHRRLEREAEQSRRNQQVRAVSEDREKMSQEMARLSERKTAAENELETTAAKLWEEYQLTESAAKELCVPFENVTELRRQVAELRSKIRGLGNVNVGSIEEYKEVSQRYETLSAQVADVEKSRAELLRMISELSREMEKIFAENFKVINEHFGRIFRELFGGGSASLALTEPDKVLDSGIEIQVAPPGKIIKNLSALSGGEQSLVAISIYFAILAVNPSPFCVLDEIEAALDDVNVVRYAQYLRRISDKTQFIVITHRRGTMEEADVLYGVTMQEDGVSKLLKLDLEQVDASLVV